jgi:hypothetical protein
MQSVESPVLPADHRWDDFLDRLMGPGCCEWSERSWTCHGDLRFSKRVLHDLGLSESAIAVSVQYFRDHGGYCDCEVVLNVR